PPGQGPAVASLDLGPPEVERGLLQLAGRAEAADTLSAGCELPEDPTPGPLPGRITMRPLARSRWIALHAASLTTPPAGLQMGLAEWTPVPRSAPPSEHACNDSTPDARPGY